MFPGFFLNPAGLALPRAAHDVLRAQAHSERQCKYNAAEEDPERKADDVPADSQVRSAMPRQAPSPSTSRPG